MVTGINDFGFVYENNAGFVSPYASTGFIAPAEYKTPALTEFEQEYLKKSLAGNEKNKNKKTSKPRPPRVKVQYDGTIKYKGVTYSNIEEFKKVFPDAKVETLAQQVSKNKKTTVNSAEPVVNQPKGSPKGIVEPSGIFPSNNADEYGKFLDEQNKPKITIKSETAEVPKNIYPHKDAQTYENMLKAAKNVEKAKGASKFAKFGKWGAAIAAGALLLGGAYALLSGKDEAPAKPDNTQTPAKPAAEPPKKEENSPANPPANPAEETSEGETTTEQPVVAPPVANTEEVTAETLEPGKTLITSDGKIYKVKDRDNVWNIAKNYLKEKNKDVQGYEPSAQEIKAEEQRIMELNNLSFDNTREKKNYYCIIHPNDILKLEKAA